MNEKKIAELREEIKELNAKRYKRFNVMLKTEAMDRLEQEAKEYLLTILAPGDVVYTSLDHVSQSGMTRRISVFVSKVNKEYNNGNPYIQRITWHVSKLLGYSLKNDALVVGGCGMDMGYSVVYNLSSRLFKDNFECIGEHCPSNDHSNSVFDRSKENVGRLHSDGGYALRHEWL